MVELEKDAQEYVNKVLEGIPEEHRKIIQDKKTYHTATKRSWLIDKVSIRAKKKMIAAITA